MNPRQEALTPLFHRLFSARSRNPAFPDVGWLLVCGLLASCSGESNPTPSNPDNVTILITEAAATNAAFLDEDGDSSDWLELHNASSEPINLKGWTLSDNPNKPYLWTLPDITLAPGAYRVVWASDKDRKGAQLHTNFKLSSDGEEVVLSDASGKVVSRLLVHGAPTGYSVGLNASGENGFFAVPTPGTANTTSWFTGWIDRRVTFSQPGGENSEGSVALSGAADGQVIRYTLDGTVPTANSPLYTSPIPIQGATTVRARIFQADQIPSATASRTFLPGKTHDLPVVTLITEPRNLFDENTGIYVFGKKHEKEPPFFGANFWQDWEREIHFSFYEADGTLGTTFDAGVKIFGGWSRANDQRSLSIFARSRYGTDEIIYPLFQDVLYDEFQALVLRNSGNDWMRTMLRDATLTSLMEGTGLDYTAYRPVVVYLNGEYWGIYNLREKVNEHFLASRHAVDADRIDLLEGNATVVQGSNAEYRTLMQFVESRDLSTQNYGEVVQQMDINNFITYQVAQIYFNNVDWPGNNIKYWKAPGTQWRWILFDVDFSFGLYGDEDYMNNTLEFATATLGPNWPNPPWSTLLLRRLLTNDAFKQDFINTFADTLNSRFLPDHVIQRIDQNAAAIASEIPRHYERWQRDLPEDTPEEDIRTLEHWHEDLEQMRTFARQRPLYLWRYLAEFFELQDPVPVSIENASPDGGRVLLNSLPIADAQWSGQYFPGIPITLVAEAKPGYRFSHWGDDSTNTSNVWTTDPALQTTFAPVFVRQ
jgi:hypothetical protein